MIELSIESVYMLFISTVCTDLLLVMSNFHVYL